MVGDGGTWYLFQGLENCSKIIYPIFKVWKISHLRLRGSSPYLAPATPPILARLQWRAQREGEAKHRGSSATTDSYGCAGK